jgi:AcrR family transcriptional regulator
MISEIKAAAREQVAANGAAALSLRAIARELGMVSSAIYRYFPSRDDLLTALIIDSYDALGETAERADARVPRHDYGGRWAGACRAIRDWAVDNPHEYALLYGSPVPGYRAPQDTVPAATKVAAVLAGIVRDAVAAGTLAAPSDTASVPDTAPPTDTAPPVLPATLSADAARMRELLMPGAPDELVMRSLLAWTAVFGMISLEMFGHLNNVISDYGEAFDHQVRQLARYVGLVI